MGRDAHRLLHLIRATPGAGAEMDLSLVFNIQVAVNWLFSCISRGGLWDRVGAAAALADAVQSSMHAEIPVDPEPGFGVSKHWFSAFAADEEGGWAGRWGGGAADGALMPEAYGADGADRAGWTDGVWCVGMGGLGGPVKTRDFVEVGMGFASRC
jgi:hypothetical protein